jgi:formate dehydrogenase major subunit
VEVRRTNHYSQWQDRNRQDDLTMRQIAGVHVDAAE